MTEGALSVDLVDRQTNALVWSGTASGTVTQAARDNPQAAIDQAVQQIFAKYPKPRRWLPSPNKSNWPRHAAQVPR